MTLKISSITLNTPHLEEMRGFYEALGISFDQVKVDKGGQMYKGRVEGFELSLISTAHKDTPIFARMQIGVQVPCVDTVCDKIRLTSAQMMLDPMDFPDGKRAIVIDPDGHSVEISEVVI